MTMKLFGCEIVCEVSEKHKLVTTYLLNSVGLTSPSKPCLPSKLEAQITLLQLLLTDGFNMTQLSYSSGKQTIHMYMNTEWPLRFIRNLWILKFGEFKREYLVLELLIRPWQAQLGEEERERKKAKEK